MAGNTWRNQAEQLIHFDRGRVGFGDRPVLLIVDMQAEYTDTDSPWHVPQLESVAAAIQRLLVAARRKAVPVVYTYNGFRKDLADAGLLPRKLPDLEAGVCQEGTEGARILESIAPGAGDLVINKKRYSAFFGTEMDLLLRGWEVDTTIVTGCVTSGCIRETAYDAFQRGYRAIVPEECVGDRYPTLHEHELLVLDTWMADVIPLADVVTYVNALPEGAA